MKTAPVAALAAISLVAFGASAFAQARATRPAAAAPAASAPAAASAVAPPQPASGPPVAGLCLISQERAVAGSSAGRAFAERMRQLGAQVQAELKPEQDALETDARAFEQQQAALTPEQRQTRGTAIQTRLNAFQQKAGLRNRELQATQQKALARIGTELDPVVRAIYTAKSCSVLFSTDGSAFFWNPASDLTDQAIAQLNTRMPSITFDRERIDANAPAPAQR